MVDDMIVNYILSALTRRQTQPAQSCVDIDYAYLSIQTNHNVLLDTRLKHYDMKGFG